MSDEAILAAGTVVKFSLTVGQTDFSAEKEIEGVISIGAVGEMSEAKERTVLKDKTKKYGAGMKDAPDKTIKFQRYPLNADQNAFVAAAIANETVMIEVEYEAPAGASKGEVAVMEFKLLGFEKDDVTGEDWQMGTINAKQNSIAWTDAVPV